MYFEEIHFFAHGDVLAGDYKCYNNTSTTNHFKCGSHGNCVWWAAYKRPDLAKKIVGGGWDGGQWYNKFEKLGVSVGSQPEAGDIVEFSSPGHVAYVIDVFDDGSFDVSEMDWYGSIGFVDGVNYATYHPAGSGKYRRGNGSMKWVLKGFIHQPNSSEKPQTEQEINTIPYAKSGKLLWFPFGVECKDATRWINADTWQVIADKTNQSVSGAVVCEQYGILPQCSVQIPQ